MVLICQLLQDSKITIIAGVGICVTGIAADTLERVNNNQNRIRMLMQELSDLLLQSLVKLC